MNQDHEINTLIDLNGSIMVLDGGYWIKIEARKIKLTEDIPHGISYSLTLHNPYGKRILGFDNAHAIKPPKKFKYAGRKLTSDHKHRSFNDKGVPYEFQNAAQLLTDFFAEVDKKLKEIEQK